MIIPSLSEESLLITKKIFLKYTNVYLSVFKKKLTKRESDSSVEGSVPIEIEL